MTEGKRLRVAAQSGYGSSVKKINTVSPAGNRTPVSRVTGGDTHHYTTEELREYIEKKSATRVDITTEYLDEQFENEGKDKMKQNRARQEMNRKERRREIYKKGKGKEK